MTVSDDEVQSEIDNLLASNPVYQKLDKTTVEAVSYTHLIDNQKIAILAAIRENEKKKAEKA